MKNKNVVFNGIIAFVLLLSIFGASFVMRKEIPQQEVPLIVTDTEKSTYLKINEIMSMIDQQSAIDDSILSEFQSKTYTWEDPLIIIDPYEISPLTAIILFKSLTPTTIRFHIEGKTPDTSVDYQFEEALIDHIIPIYGLYPGVTNTVSLIMTDENAVSVEKTFTIETESLLPSLAQNRFHIYKSALPMSPGFTFSYSNGFGYNNRSAIDANGDYRWYLTKSFNYPGSFNQGESLFLSYGQSSGTMFFLELNYLGKVLNVYHSPYGNHHDIEVTKDSLLVLGSDNAPNTIEDFIYSINRNDGKVTKTLSYLDVLIRTRNFGAYYSNQDWIHMNSIIEHQGDVIISSNRQSSVVRNDWDGNIKWILGDPAQYTSAYQDFLLKPIGSGFLYPYNQHAVEILPDTDGNPDTLDIILFDNGTSRFIVDQKLQDQIIAHKIETPSLFSRMVHYQINEMDMTVKQIWQYGKNRTELFSPNRGDADLLINGNRLGTFFIELTKEEITTRHAVYVELNTKNDVVWECVATSANLENSYIEYRSERFELYNSRSIQLSLSLKANNFIPEELIQKAAAYGRSLTQ